MMVFTLDEAAAHLHVSKKTVQRLIDLQRLAAVNVGTGSVRRSLRVTSEALEAFQAARGQAVDNHSQTEALA